MKYSAFIVIAIILGAVAVAFVNSNIRKVENKRKADKLTAVHNEAVEKINNSLESFATLVSGLRAYIDQSPDLPNQYELQAYINRALSEINYDDSIVVSYLDTAHVFKYSFTRTQIDPSGLVGKNTADIRDYRHIQKLNQLMKDSVLHLFEPINLVEGWPGIPLVFSVRKNGKSIGYVSPIINFGKIIQPVYQNEKTKSEFVFKFNIIDGPEFDRYAVHDGKAVYTDEEDPENYSNFNVVPQSFIYTTLDKYNLKIRVGTAYKTAVLPISTTEILIWVWYISSAILVLVLLRILNKTKRLNAELILIGRKNSKQNRDLSRHVHELKERELIIEQNNLELKKLSVIASKTDNYVIIVSSDDKIEWINDGFVQITGYEFDEAFGKMPSEILAGELTKVEVVREIDSHIFDKKIPYKGVITNYTKNNEPIVVEIEVIPVLDEYRHLLNYFVIGKDITEKLKNQAELQKQRDIALQQREIIENTLEEMKASEQIIKQQHNQLLELSQALRFTDNAVMVIDKTGKIEWANEGFTKLYGMTLEEFTEKSDNIFECTTNKDITEFLLRAINNEETVTYQVDLLHHCGKRMWVQTTWTPIIEDGEMTKLVAIDSDISTLIEAKTLINAQNKEIKDSISYAQHIQQAVLPNEEYIKKVLDEHFILFKPKDIISGDFYFVRRVRNNALIAAADCTGHGVPGAILSVLSISLLNEIIRRPTVTQTNHVLDILRENIKKTLNQTGKFTDQKDGLDIALCAIDFKKRKLEFSGANLPVYIVRKSCEENYVGAEPEVTLISLKPDKQPISIYPYERPFNCQTFDLQKDDVVYLFSDGYVDQFGGKNGKKYMSRRFKKLLQEIYFLPMSKQKEILENEYNEWTSTFHQVDDVLVMGIRIE